MTIKVNHWPRNHFKGNAAKAADSLTRASKEFLLAHSQGKKPAVPDSVWHGNDCWVLEMDGQSWRIGAFAREVMAVLVAANTPEAALSPAEKGEA